jgi:hypothetical protein
MIAAAKPVGHPVAATARRIRFVPMLRFGERVLREFTTPEHCFAVSEPLDPESLTLATDVGETLPDPHAEFDFLFLPGGNSVSPQWHRLAEKWMARSSAADIPTVELMLRSDRILWRPGRAVLFGAPERLEETLAGLIDFAFYEGQLRRLEGECEADWATADADAGLTHRINPRDRRHWPHVAAMTERVTRRRIRFARLEKHLEKASPHLPGPARRMVSELLVQAETQDRLRAVDDGLEVLEDLYELANDRLSEFSYFWRGQRLEMWIVVLLVAEVVLLLLELGLR